MRQPNPDDKQTDISLGNTVCQQAYASMPRTGRAIFKLNIQTSLINTKIIIRSTLYFGWYRCAMWQYQNTNYIINQNRFFSSLFIDSLYIMIYKENCEINVECVLKTLSPVQFASLVFFA